MYKPIITFLNHSAFIVSYRNTKILCDPWFFGSAFQEGWELLYDRSHDINDLDFDYIWISHEHPDHFSIPTLKSLNKKTTFLYQQTNDKKVLNYLEGQGHKVIEIEDKQRIKIGDINIVLFICDGYDSSILFEFDNKYSFLNINDSRVDINDQLEKDIIPHLSINKVDLLAFQFSYANWAGNKGDIDIAKDQQRLTDNKNIYILEKIKPINCLLTASYVYYCHEENFFWNDNFFLEDALNSLEKTNFGTQIIVPEPNQKFDLPKINPDLKLSNKKAINFWKELHKSREIKFRTKTINDIDQLKNSYFKFYERIFSRNRLIRKLTGVIDPKYFNLEILLEDIDKKVKISLFKKDFYIFTDKKENEKYDISITSETFIFLMRNDFSRGTLSINSRIKFDYNNAHKFFIFFFIPYANNIHKFYEDKRTLIKDLRSIKNTSVLQSILKFNEKLESRLDSELNF